MISVKKFETIYGKNGDFRDSETAQETVWNDYGGYLDRWPLTFLAAYVRAMWETPEKIREAERGELKRTLKRAQEWASVRAHFRI